MKAAILVALIGITFSRPLWGVAILLVLTSTLFHLSQYATVPLPLGYVEPTEAVIAAALGRAAIDRFWRRSPRYLSRLSGTLVSAIVPYVIWQTLCAGRGLIVWAGSEHFRFALRFVLSGVLPWLLPLIALRYYDRTHSLFRAAFWIAFATAAVHLGIQLFDYRPIMQAAYIPPAPEGGEYGFVVEAMRLWIAQASIVRLLPQGILLIMFFAVFAAATFILNGWSRSKWPLIATVVLSAAVFITVARNLLFSLLAGVAAAVVLAFAFGLVRTRTMNRLLISFAAVAALATGVAALSPRLIGLWRDRVEQLFGEDSQIFSEENRARGRDNLAAMSAIADNPVFGLGTSRYPQEYSLRLEPATDTHPMLGIGLVGGIPAMLLVIRLQWLLIMGLVREIRRDRRLGRPLVPFLAVVVVNALVVNLSGAGGSLYGTGLLAFVIFVSGAWAICASACAERHLESRYVRMAALNETNESSDLDPHPVLQPGWLHRADDPVSS